MRVTTRTEYLPLNRLFVTTVYLGGRAVDATGHRVRPTAKQVRKFKQRICREAAFVKREVEKHIALHKPNTPEDAERVLRNLWPQTDNPSHYKRLLAGVNIRVELQPETRMISVEVSV